ncbi:MAG: putative Mg2+ transporter-C (MgtC) family protein [Pseudonocardiales bacterium]|jgi:putative Mg2+ transporter-C (MgtC) family protein|nr:putative Mg2+ transporter-C (MgtC) family protein [Pseudonocardiales bacterium]MDT7671180.1 putative Mg2+ transporter-C (MgtC) family protein [Pseudonocardiales bacterium]MDT7748816.1 putative Mg2+ transporter-C (MgtC) family protein [Pseudonocardiales bacterium]
MSTAEMLLRLGAGVGLGTVIGFERQYRARMAGLRTNALVAGGATLFVLLSAHGFTGGDADPTRVAAQIVSGIGFLGAGVILREGLTVRGLNTAATLWCAAAVGSLAGAGLYSIAVAGTVAVVAVNIVLRPVGRVVDRRPDTGAETPTSYEFLAVTDDASEAHVRALLVQALARTDFALRSVTSTNVDANGGKGRVEVRAQLSAEQRDDKQMETAISRLSLEPSVTSVRWQTELPGVNGEDEG